MPLTLLMALTMGIAAAAGPDDWRTLYQEDHEGAQPGARLWGGIGASGPEGGSFAGVTGRTSSAFDGGWRSYELRLGSGGSLRERYFWLLRRFEGAPHNALRFRCDFMGDATMSDTSVGFEFFGGGGSDLKNSLFGVGASGGTLSVGKQPLAKLQPHVWYRLELELRRADATNRLVGTATVREQGQAEPRVVEIALPLNPAAIPLRSLKLGMGRLRSTPGPETRFYLDNLKLETRHDDK